MAEYKIKTCHACLRNEGIHCANEYGDLNYRTLYKPHWTKPSHPFITKGQIRACRRYQNLAKPASTDITIPEVSVLEKIA